MLTNLEAAILKCDRAGSYSQLRESIHNNSDLNNNDREKFAEIWRATSDFENWNNADIILGVKITHQKLKALFNLSDETIAIIVRCAAHDWK